MPRIDDATSRMLAEIRYMPLAYYLDFGKADPKPAQTEAGSAPGQPKALPQMAPDNDASLVPQDEWERLDWLLTCTALPAARAA
jgi:hypothetical protein